MEAMRESVVRLADTTRAAGSSNTHSPVRSQSPMTITPDRVSVSEDVQRPTWLQRALGSVRPTRHPLGLSEPLLLSAQLPSAHPAEDSEREITAPLLRYPSLSELHQPELVDVPQAQEFHNPLFVAAPPRHAESALIPPKIYGAYYEAADCIRRLPPQRQAQVIAALLKASDTVMPHEQGETLHRTVVVTRAANPDIAERYFASCLQHVRRISPTDQIHSLSSLYAFAYHDLTPAHLAQAQLAIDRAIAEMPPESAAPFIKYLCWDIPQRKGAIQYDFTAWLQKHIAKLPVALRGEPLEALLFSLRNEEKTSMRYDHFVETVVGSIRLMHDLPAEHHPVLIERILAFFPRRLRERERDQVLAYLRDREKPFTLTMNVVLRLKGYVKHARQPKPAIVLPMTISHGGQPCVQRPWKRPTLVSFPASPPASVHAEPSAAQLSLL